MQLDADGPSKSNCRLSFRGQAGRELPLPASALSDD
jgi:hypothetical protein